MTPAGSFTFVLNGEERTVTGAPVNRTLLQYLRGEGRALGSKEGCSEGDCGACTVLLSDVDADGERTFRAVTSCITFLPMVAGREVVTAEGLAGEAGALHPVQRAMVEHYGSQCGYCTPGFVCSMAEGCLREAEEPGVMDAPGAIADQLSGNLCRCTGYRPIRDAMIDALAETRGGRGGGTRGPDDVRPDVLATRLARGQVGAFVPEPVAYGVGAETFYRPTSLAELLALRAAHPEAELVAGATELGVYVNKGGRAFPVLVSTEGVAELRAVRESGEALQVGGAATLTALEEALGGDLPALGKMLRVFASRQIRSRATVAGNLVTASPIGDLAPVLLALDAEVVLAKAAPGGGVAERVVPLAEFFVGYRKTVLAKDEIMTWIRIPRVATSDRVRVDSYKVSKRRELDISIAAAAFAVRLDAAGKVVKARFAFGGVAATPMRATAAETLAVGRTWDEALAKDVARALESEVSPIDDHRSKKEFRRGLAGSLFLKFFHGDASEAQEGALGFEVGTPRVQGTSRVGSGRELVHESAALHATGAARYVDDVARQRPMLEVWPVLSPVARGKLLAVRVDAALGVPGVVAVLRAADVPGDNDIGAVRKDEPLFADGEVRFRGQMVAAVVAETLDAARAGAAKVEVDVEAEPPIVGIRAALAAGSFHNEPHVIARGDVDAALAAAPRRLEGELDVGGQEHFYLESQAAYAEVGDDGEVFVSSSTQHPSEVQAVVSHVLHLARHKVVVQSPRMGGGFGGKETQGNGFAAVVALAATKLGRPARIQLDRDVDMAVTGKRHPFLARFDVGYDDDGHVLAAKIALVSDGGYALDLSESITDRALFHLDNAYYLPAVRFEGRVAKTNVCSHTAFRGFGGPQGMVVIEDVLDRVARRTGLAPEVVRERNLYRGRGETNTTHYGQELGDERLPAIFRTLVERARFDERRRAVEAFNASSRLVKRGLAVTPVKFGISFTATFLNQAGALVLVYRDGTVQVNHGGTEMGQGLYTKMLGVAVRELGVAAASVRVMQTRTDKVPNTSATAASSGADLNGAAVRNACLEIRGRLEPVAAALLGERAGGAVAPASVVFEGGVVRTPLRPGVTATFAEVVERAYLAQVNLGAQGFYRTPGIGYDRSKGRGKPFYYFAYGAAVTEVEVDGYSGMKRVLRVDVLHDVGESLNPGVDRGQIEGAFVQGMGWLTGEELAWSPDGKLLTHSASTYAIPSVGDAPAAFHVELLPRAAQEGTIHGSKAVGEPPFMLAISVREALRDAVAAFGGRGEVALACPATHEAIWTAVRRRLEDAASAEGAEAAE